MTSSDNGSPFRVLVSEADGPAVQVQVDVHYRPHRFIDDQRMICLTQETFSLKQFEDDVDYLITELHTIKKKARQIFDKNKSAR